MKLSELFATIPHRLVCGDEDVEIRSVEYDSRKVEPGSLFVCLKGFQRDGHAFAAQALERGAAALVVECGGSRPNAESGEEQALVAQYGAAGAGKTVVQVEDTREALAHLAAAWFDHPAEGLCLIGITGTKGKTTTAHMIRGILEQQGEKAGMIGTLGASAGSEHIPTQNTTPEPCELHRLFAKMKDTGCRYVVMEVSSQALKQKRTAGLVFDYGIFLNLSPDHIGAGEHRDFAEYLACKRLLFFQTRQAIVNVSDAHWREVIPTPEGMIGFSACREADFWGTEIHNLWEPGFLGVEFALKGKREGHISLNLPGKYNVENALAAIAAASALGISTAVIQEALKKVSVKGRTQLLAGTAHFSTFLIDYAHNALSMENLLETLKGYHPGRLVCMFGGGGNKPKQRRFDMGRAAGKYADLTILTMDNPRYESMDDINREIIRGLEVYGGAYQVIPDRKEAIHYLIDHSGKEDIVVFVGKGHEEYQEIRGRRYYFSEEKVVEEYLQEK